MKTTKRTNYVPFILSFILSAILCGCGNIDLSATSSGVVVGENSAMVTTVPEKTKNIGEGTSDKETQATDTADGTSNILSDNTSSITAESTGEKITETDKETQQSSVSSSTLSENISEIKTERTGETGTTSKGTEKQSGEQKEYKTDKATTTAQKTVTTVAKTEAPKTTTTKASSTASKKTTTTAKKQSATTTTTAKKATTTTTTAKKATTTTTTTASKKYNPTGLEASFNRLRMGVPTDADVKAIEKALNDYYMSYNGKTGTITFRTNCIYDDALKHFGISADNDTITFKNKLWFATDSNLKGFHYDPNGLISDAHLNCYVQNDCSYDPNETAEQGYWENRWFIGSCYAMVNDAITRAEYNYGQHNLTGEYGKAWTMYFKVEKNSYTWHVGDYVATSWSIWALNSTE